MVAGTEKWGIEAKFETVRTPKQQGIFSRPQRAHEPPESERFLTRKIA